MHLFDKWLIFDVIGRLKFKIKQQDDNHNDNIIVYFY